MQAKELIFDQPNYFNRKHNQLLAKKACGMMEDTYLPKMFRRYTITIEASGETAEHLNGIEKVLGCSISEPSNWVEYGSTKERGLTFLDENGRELTSPVFIHQTYFTSLSYDDESEASEIRNFVVEALARYRSIKPDDVRIKISEYNLH